MSKESILVTGATGYIGSRLIPQLLYKGYSVRALVRSKEKLHYKPWFTHPYLEVVEGDLFDLQSLLFAVKNCRAVYYLVHSMNAQIRDFISADREAALNLAGAAEQEGVGRIIYLSGLGEDNPNLSKHLRSRAEVGRILQNSAVPTTVLRSAIILGSGSASFELIRFLTERMPIVFAPLWVKTLSQPIAISNVLEYLAGCLENPQTAGQTYDIGGPDVLRYEDIFRIYSQIAGLPPRFILKLPYLSPRFLSKCAERITPVPAALSEPLIEGMHNPVICQDIRIQEIIPQDLLTCRQAITRSLQTLCRDRRQNTWLLSGKPNPPEWFIQGDGYLAEKVVLEASYRMLLKGTSTQFWPLVEGIGGTRGWFGTDFLWDIRGLMDWLLGGNTWKQQRRNNSRLQEGDSLKYWRVLEIKVPHVLLLLSEMKLPGDATLEFKLRDRSEQEVEVVLTVRFLPKGILGLLYWHLFYKIHKRVIKNMLLNMARSFNRTIILSPQFEQNNYE